MMRPYAVPVWTKVASDSEWTDMEWVTEEERADGILRLESERLLLEVEIVQSTTTLANMGQSTDTEHLGRRELEIRFDDIVSVSLHSRWWLPKLRIQTNNLRPLEGLPGAKRGLVNLRLKRRNWGAARTLVQEFEFALADLDLHRATQLERGDAAALPPTGDTGEG